MPGGLTSQTNKPCQVVCQFSQPDLSDLPVGLTGQTNKPCRRSASPVSLTCQTCQSA